MGIAEDGLETLPQLHGGSVGAGDVRVIAPKLTSGAQSRSAGLGEPGLSEIGGSRGYWLDERSNGG